MYASGEYKIYFERLVVQSQDIRKNVIDQRFFKQMDSFFSRPGKILDVGCGSGSFLKVCQENDWEVFGLDPSESAVTTAKEKYDLEIIHDYFENFDTNIKFDCVTFIGLEHLEEPMEGIAKARRLLNPEGLILFHSPSADCFLMKYCCENNYSPYRYIESARHVLFFSMKSIDYICDKFDLELAYIETNGLDLQTILPFEFENEVLSKILDSQRILDEYLLGDHYRVFLRKINNYN
jgi:2-polyprenyl-3-methyl-5-hydroxy-6-metoxy-1,4-benzoquinol methylase